MIVGIVVVGACFLTVYVSVSECARDVCMCVWLWVYYRCRGGRVWILIGEVEGLSPISDLPSEEGEYASNCPQFMCRCPIGKVPGELENVVWNVSLFSLGETEEFGSNLKAFLTCM